MANLSKPGNCCQGTGETSFVLCNWLERYIYLLGLIAPVVPLVCAFIAALAWDGGGNQTYSPLVMAISSLGRQDRTPLAWLFNGGFIAGAVLLGSFIVGAGITVRSLPGYFVAFFGIVATSGMAVIAIFPADSGERIYHYAPAAVAFLGIFGLAFSFTIFILFVKQDRLSKWLIVPSLFTVFCNGVFLAIMIARQKKMIPAAYLQWKGSEGAFVIKLIPTFEWLSLLSVLLWCFCVAWALRPKSR